MWFCRYESELDNMSNRKPKEKIKEICFTCLKVEEQIIKTLRNYEKQ